MLRHPGPKALLKGATCIAEELPRALGRLPPDVNIMIMRSVLGNMEQSLLHAGWEFDTMEAYN